MQEHIVELSANIVKITEILKTITNKIILLEKSVIELQCQQIKYQKEEL